MGYRLWNTDFPVARQFVVRFNKHGRSFVATAIPRSAECLCLEVPSAFATAAAIVSLECVFSSALEIYFIV
jgi:hypothetical protein